MNLQKVTDTRRSDADSLTHDLGLGFARMHNDERVHYKRYCRTMMHNDDILCITMKPQYYRIVPDCNEPKNITELAGCARCTAV